MNIALFRNGSRALILPIHKDLIDCPSAVRHWLGSPDSDAVAEINEHTPMIGIQPAELLAELLQHGFCALDFEGVVRDFHSGPAAAECAHDLGTQGPL
ncbi:hypothetical protein [Cupriavidus sp. Marseille-Q8015]